MKANYVFPGQGSQVVGMAKELYENNLEIKKIMDESNNFMLEKFNVDLLKIMFEGPIQELTRTIYSQPAIFLSNAAYFLKLKNNIEPVVVMGHSLGEYSALYAAGSININQGLFLTRKRAEFMSELIKNDNHEIATNMAAVGSENLELIIKSCNLNSINDKIVQVSNKNYPNQTIISGHKEAVYYATEYLKENNITKINFLNVEGPYHSKIMYPAEEKFKKIMDKVEVLNPKYKFICNYLGEEITSPNAIKCALVKQISNVVNWQKSIENSFKHSFDFIECGDSKIHSIQIRKNYKNCAVIDKSKYW